MQRCTVCSKKNSSGIWAIIRCPRYLTSLQTIRLLFDNLNLESLRCLSSLVLQMMTVLLRAECNVCEGAAGDQHYLDWRPQDYLHTHTQNLPSNLIKLLTVLCICLFVSISLLYPELWEKQFWLTTPYSVVSKTKRFMLTLELLHTVTIIIWSFLEFACMYTTSQVWTFNGI